MQSVFQSRINYSTTLYVLFCFLFIYLSLLLLLFFFGILRKTKTRVSIIMHYNNDIKVSNSPIIIYSLLPKFTTSSLIILLSKQFLFVIPITLHCAALFQSCLCNTMRFGLSIIFPFFQGCLMTECPNGGYYSFHKENVSFACSCKLPWTEEKCEKGKPK